MKLLTNLSTIQLIVELSNYKYTDYNRMTRDEIRKVHNALTDSPYKETVQRSKHDLIQDIMTHLYDISRMREKAEALDYIAPDFNEADYQRIDDFANLRCLEDGTDVPGIAAAVYKEFRALCLSYYQDGKWGMADSRLSDLAYSTLSILESREYAPRTLIKYRASLLNELESLLVLEKDGEYFDKLWVYLTGHSYEDIQRGTHRRGVGRDCMPSFARTVMEIWAKTYSKDKTQADKGSVTKNKSFRLFVNITRALTEANTLLYKIHSGEDVHVSNWIEVSFALALVTGRRQGEIHYSGKFELVDSHHLAFTGQLKTKGLSKKYYDANPTYTIPTLVPAELVISGLDWLWNTAGKKCENIKSVNNRISSSMSKYFKAHNMAQDFDFTNEHGGDVKVEDFKYHDLREMYAIASYEAEGKEFYKEAAKMDWIAKVLGHFTGNGTWATIGLQYMDKYELAPGSAYRY